MTTNSSWHSHAEVGTLPNSEQAQPSVGLQLVERSRQFGPSHPAGPLLLVLLTLFLWATWHIQDKSSLTNAMHCFQDKHWWTLQWKFTSCNWQEQGLHSLHHKNQPLSLLFIALFHTFKTYFPSSLQNISKMHVETVVAWSYEQLHTRVAIILIYSLPPRCRDKCNKIRGIGSDTHWILKPRITTSFFLGCQSLTVLATVTPFLDHTQHSHVIWSDSGFKEMVLIRLQNI